MQGGDGMHGNSPPCPPTLSASVLTSSLRPPSISYHNGWQATSLSSPPFPLYLLSSRLAGDLPPLPSDSWQHASSIYVALYRLYRQIRGECAERHFSQLCRSKLSSPLPAHHNTSANDPSPSPLTSLRMLPP